MYQCPVLNPFNESVFFFFFFLQFDEPHYKSLNLDFKNKQFINHVILVWRENVYGLHVRCLLILLLRLSQAAPAAGEMRIGVTYLQMQ